MQTMQSTQSLQSLQNGYVGHMASMAPVAQMTSTDGIGPAAIPGNALLADPNSKRGRSKACLDCRKSKVRNKSNLIDNLVTNKCAASLYP
jgi:F-box/leucine-rich repeat protein 10/11